jgi:hypothetical protein
VFDVVATAGVIVSVANVAYNPPVLIDTFDVGQYFFTASTIDSVSVEVDGVLQVPYIDYTFDYTVDPVDSACDKLHGCPL